MKKAIPITTLFLDIGGVLLTAGSSSPTSAMARAWRRCVTANPWTQA